eukprot:g12395.t2
MLDDEDAPWEPLGFVDYAVLGGVGSLQAAALIVCVHLMHWRKWPPYLVKNVDIVIFMTLAGFFWTFAKALETGFIRRSEGDILAWCYLETFLSWSTLFAHAMAFFVRVHRMWRILIRHDENMWPAKYQIMFLSSPSLVPLLVAIIVPDTYFFDEVVNSCNTTTASRNVVLGMSAIAFYTICHLWFVCGRQLRWVRKQFNEYQAMKRTLIYLTLILFTYAIVVVGILDNHHVTVRRVAIVYPALTTHTLLWGSIGEPFAKKLVGDEQYLWAYTKGFSELPSPAQLKASLAEQLSVEQLRTEFRGYIETKVAQELVDFYLDSLDREEVEGFFDRQAVTMRIVERYIREGAPEQVNISGECREDILSTDVTAHDIFDRARVEVLAVMETNFQQDFVATEGFRRIVDASELEQREMRLLKAGGYLRSDPPSPASAPFSSRSVRLVGFFKSLPLVKSSIFSCSSSSATPVGITYIAANTTNPTSAAAATTTAAAAESGACSGQLDRGR